MEDKYTDFEEYDIADLELIINEQRDLYSEEELDRAKEVLERHRDMMAYFIYSDAQGQLAVWYSPSLKDKICE